MANSASGTLTDNRNVPGKNQPVWKYVITYTVEADGGTTELTDTIHNFSGIIQKIVVDVGAAGGVVATVNVAIDDDGDDEIFAVTSLAESTKYTYDVHEPVCGDVDIGLTPSDDPAAGQDDWTITVTLRGI